MLIEQGERTVRVGAFPIGIDFDHYESLARAAEPGDEKRERLVLGVDRLDYTKGIPERLRAFERLLELHPEHREKVALLQVAVPSRSQVAEYRELKREIDELVGRVNGRFGTASWSPIRYLHRSFSSERLAAMYRDADVGLLTPLRDGMNLVAKEFVACQVGDPGVLVLSRLAGAAETMREAIHVNPYDVDGTAHALHRALTMDETERRSRLTALRRRERRRDVYAWVESFLDAAMAGHAGLGPPEAPDFEAWFGDAFFTGHRLALFLDYDGTLTPLCAHPTKAVLSPEMRGVLMACVRRSDTDVAVISGRALSDVVNMVDEKEITYAGSHGMEISFPDGSSFRHEDLPYFQAKTDALAAALGRTAPPGAWSERKGATLTFHFRQVDAELQAKAAAKARELVNAAGFQARDAHFAVEAIPPVAWDKGRAVLQILRARYGPDWPEHVRAVYVGDDLTDEDAFRILGGLGFTFRVGTTDTPTVAARRLPDVDTVQRLLEWLARRPSAASALADDDRGGRELPGRRA
jgi:trehalose 6-phosphate synthase/phosphatase